MDQHRSPSEAHWIQQARHGDPEAFGAVVEKYQVAVFNLCYRMLSDYHQAEDAAQETFLKAYTRLERYDESRPLRTWLLSIAAHHCIDLLRRRALLRFEPIGELELPARGGNPEASLLRREQEQEVARLLAGLSPEERAIVTLRYWYDMPIEEIGSAVGMSSHAVRTRLYRSRQALAQRANAGSRRLGRSRKGAANEPQAV